MRLMLLVDKPPIALPHSFLPRSRPALMRPLLPQEHLVLAEVTELEVGSPGSPLPRRWRLAVLEDIQRFGARLTVVGLDTMTAARLKSDLVGFVSVPLTDFTSPTFA